MEGNPKPTVSWRRSDDPEVLSINRQLKISPVSRYDAGTYICGAVNAVGAGATQQWNIDVQCEFENPRAHILAQVWFGSRNECRHISVENGRRELRALAIAATNGQFL